MIWLGLIAQPFYQAQFGFPPGEEPRLTYLAAMDRRPILLTAMTWPGVRRWVRSRR